MEDKGEINCVTDNVSRGAIEGHIMMQSQVPQRGQDVAGNVSRSRKVQLLLTWCVFKIRCTNEMVDAELLTFFPNTFSFVFFYSRFHCGLRSRVCACV